MDMQTVIGVVLLVGMVAVVIRQELKDKAHVAELKAARDKAAADLAAAKADFEAKMKNYLGTK